MTPCSRSTDVPRNCLICSIPSSFVGICKLRMLQRLPVAPERRLRRPYLRRPSCSLWLPMWVVLAEGELGLLARVGIRVSDLPSSNIGVGAARFGLWPPLVFNFVMRELTILFSSPTCSPSNISLASSLCPTSSNASVASWPPTSRRTSSPPLRR